MRFPLDRIYEDADEILSSVDLSPLRNKTVLITGVTGLVGTYLLASLAIFNEKSGANVHVYGQGHSMPASHTREIARRGDFLIIDQPFDIGADVIIHAAGYAQPSVFLQNPAETIRINTEMTHNLLKNLNHGGKFLFISSSEVYSGLRGLVQEHEIGTTNPYHPRACYIEGKRCGEAIVNSFRNRGLNSVHATSARLSLAYGPGTRQGDKRAMSTFIDQALQTGKIEMKFPGNEHRTYCYILDAVEMLWQVLLNGTKPVYNVGGHSSISIANLALMIGNLTGAQVTAPEQDAGMPGAPEIVRMDVSRVETEFEKKDYISMEEGLKATIDWHRVYHG